MQYTNNGQSTISPTNCGNIDLLSSTSTSINLGINLSKPNGQVVGLSGLYVYTQKSPSDNRVLRSSFLQIQESFWNHPSSGNDTYSYTPPSFLINSSDFNVSGGTLFVVFKSNGGVEYQSCNYTITKTPTPSFALSPTSLSLDCGDTSSRTFTVTAANIPNGVTPIYQWSNSGWSVVSSTTNSLTLQPSSGTILPLTVSVIPYVNGVAYPTITCTVSRTAIASSGSITGNATVCTSSTYSLTGLSTGQSVTWSLSNATAGTLSPTTGTSTTFTKTGGGSVYLAATVSNSCGQSYQPTPKNLFVGAPLPFSLVRASNETCDTKYHYVPFEIPNRNPLITYTFNVPPIPGISVTQSTQTYNGVLQNVLRFPKTYAGFVDFTVSTTNSCGSFAYYAEEEINSCSGIGLAATSTYTLEQTTMYSVYPNPSSDVINVNLREENNIPETQTPIVATLYNLMGEEKRNVTIKNNIATIPVNNLPKGIYILKINIDGTIENHQVVVE